MNDENLNNQFEEEQDFKLVPANSEADSADGKKISDEDFKFVQQDEDIHDTKFNTKPTTFFRDAMRRFAKNKSSVVGAIILGILFILAIILPIDGVIPYEIDTQAATLNYETNLPPKLFATGTGFWDGTSTLTNQAYPYDDDGNYTGLGGSDACIVEIGEAYEGYGDSYSSDGKGGYATVTRDVDSAENNGFGYMYSVSYTYDFESNDYDITFTLGWKEDEDFTQPDFDVLLYVPSTSSYYSLTDYSLEYGSVAVQPEDGASVYEYESQSYSLNELIEANETLQEDFNGDFSSVTACVGLMFKADVDYKTAIYVKDFTITSSSASTVEQTQMGYRSFTDANNLVGQSRTSGGTTNPRYWANNSSDRFAPTDVRVTRYTITYDMYEVKYGVNTLTIAKSVITSWVEAGLVEYTDGDPTSYKKTEAGENDNSVYVESINTDGGSTLSVNAIIWKYLGYDSMPIHIFGTDSKGRDMLKYVFAGLRYSLILGIIVALINVLIGVIWGSISGYFGGKVDLIMERFVDILSGIPWIVLMTVLCIKLGQTFFVFALALCLTGWIGTESVTRSQFYRYKGREYVLAARTLGAKAPRLIFRHILPNAMGTIITNCVLMVPSTIFSEATISYLGLGLSGLSSLGVILSDNQQYLSTYPYQVILPAVIISLLMICFNLFGNGLRDAFNPSLKGSD